MSPEILSRILWGVFAAEIVGLAAVGVFLERSMHGPSGGGVGTWLLIIPLIGICVCVTKFLATDAVEVRVSCLVFLVLPILLVGFGESINSIQKWSLARESSEILQGERIFTTPETKALGSAIYWRNVEQVKQILPMVKNLNQPLANNKTVLSFAVSNSGGADSRDAANRSAAAAGRCRSQRYPKRGARASSFQN